MFCRTCLQHTLDFLRNRGGADENDVGMRLRGPHVPLRHGSDCSAKLLHHGFRRAATLTHIALLATLQADVVGHVDIDLRVEKPSQLWPVQGEQSFDDDKLSPGEITGFRRCECG